MSFIIPSQKWKTLRLPITLDHMTSSLYYHPIKFLHIDFRILPKTSDNKTTFITRPRALQFCQTVNNIFRKNYFLWQDV